MELDSGGNWKTLQLLRSKHQFFIANLETYKLAAQIKSSQGKDLPVELKMLVRLSGKDCDDAAEALKEASERQAIMHLFACFERIIRVDGQLRGEQQSRQHHTFLQKPHQPQLFLCDSINGYSAGSMQLRLQSNVLHSKPCGNSNSNSKKSVIP